jgi:hypothetical protein
VKKPKTEAKKSGLRYQKKIEGWLQRHYGGAAHIGEWLRYEDASGRRWCQPDAWVVGTGKVAVFEVKLRHAELAWWQLTQLYAPLLHQLYGMPVVPVEIVHSYDPHEWFVGEAGVVFTPGDLRTAIMSGESEKVVVFQWRP